MRTNKNNCEPAAVQSKEEKKHTKIQREKWKSQSVRTNKICWLWCQISCCKYFNMYMNHMISAAIEQLKQFFFILFEIFSAAEQVLIEQNKS